MLSQLGSIVFDGAFSPDSIESTDTTSYAQHELINLKPIIKPTGNNLEEYAISLHLNAAWVKPAEALLELKTAKDNFEVLPFLMGTGQYLGDFVITEITHVYNQATADGALVDATVDIKIMEYSQSDKLSQQQQADRKRAFATGDKRPVNVVASQGFTVPQLAQQDISAVNSQADVVERSVSQYENNESQRQSLSDKIQRTLEKIDGKLDDYAERIQNIEILNDVTSILTAITTVKAQIGYFSWPITSIDDLRSNNRDLQNAIRGLGTVSSELINLVITRAA